jgi:hypothetical protein
MLLAPPTTKILYVCGPSFPWWAVNFVVTGAPPNWQACFCMPQADWASSHGERFSLVWLQRLQIKRQNIEFHSIRGQSFSCTVTTSSNPGPSSEGDQVAGWQRQEETIDRSWGAAATYTQLHMACRPSTTDTGQKKHACPRVCCCEWVHSHAGADLRFTRDLRK